MTVSPFAGKPATPAMLVNVPKLITAYCADAPDPSVPRQRVSFGTSGQWPRKATTIRSLIERD